LTESFEKKLGDIEKQINPTEIKSTFAQLPTDPLEWIKTARPYVGKIKRTFAWNRFGLRSTRTSHQTL